jgi:2-oxoglutarate ferredoxin oxidoreductase subunit alpha
MPTYTEQGELQFVIHAGHGEFPRIVMAPADAAEAYSLTIVAFHLADTYHVPVFILTDKYINESQWCVPMDHFRGTVAIDRGPMRTEKDLPQDGSFQRYTTDATDGVSPRSTPGTKGGFYIANSYEHDGAGFVTEDAKVRASQVDKRMKKFAAIQQGIQPPTAYGDGDADITFVSWGSSRGPVLEAIKLINQKGMKAKLIHFSYLFPFPHAAAELLAREKRLIDVEQNATGQLAQLIRTHTGIDIKEKILKYDGRPFFPEEIVERVINN